MTDRSGEARAAVYRLVCDLGVAAAREGYDPDDFSTALMTYVAHMGIAGGGTDDQLLGNFFRIIADLREQLKGAPPANKPN